MSNQSIFTFNGHQLQARYIDNQIWFESKDIAKALSYSSSKSVTDLYNKYSKEFKPDMVTVVDSATVTKMPYKIRIFSLRGVHLIAMFARTPVAEEFRKWVLDKSLVKAKQFDKYRKNGLYSLSVVHTHINKRTPHPIAFAVFLYLRFMSGGVRLYAQAKTVDCLVAGVKHPTPYSH